MTSAILLIHCPDRRGIVAKVTRFLYDHGGNIHYLSQHVDREEEVFFMRVEWALEGFTLPRERIASTFREKVGDGLDMRFELHYSDDVPRMAVFVSKLPHCLYDILSRRQSGEWRVEIPLIISNHPDLEPLARQFGVDYHVVPVPKDGKAGAEKTQLRLLAEHNIDFIVLARYMQILSADFVARYPNRIINIHHSFLPAFAGARPYHQAHERGVKIIGATSHFVTAELDKGPIIEQDVVRVSHKDSVADFVRKGRDLEKLVLSRAVWNTLQRELLPYKNRTINFV